MKHNAKVAIILLMKGIFYKNDNEQVWLEMIESSHSVISDYFATIGLELIIDESEGYSYLKTIEQDEDAPQLPKLINARKLSYKVSLLCVILRKRLVDFDMQSESSRAIITKEEIVQNILLFLEEKFKEKKKKKEIESTIKKVEDLGFLKRLKSDSESYEIRSALKAFVDAEWLNDFDKKLQEYKEQKWS